jgi:hypothetical protein
LLLGITFAVFVPAVGITCAAAVARRPLWLAMLCFLLTIASAPARQRPGSPAAGLPFRDHHHAAAGGPASRCC